MYTFSGCSVDPNVATSGALGDFEELPEAGYCSGVQIQPYVIVVAGGFSQLLLYAEDDSGDRVGSWDISSYAFRNYANAVDSNGNFCDHGLQWDPAATIESVSS